jgi:hypothetical protein
MSAPARTAESVHDMSESKNPPLHVLAMAEIDGRIGSVCAWSLEALLRAGTVMCDCPRCRAKGAR